MKLFVYGSLKPGGWAAHLLEDDVENPQEGTTKGTLHNCGSYPALDIFNVENNTTGLVYDVKVGREDELLVRLDALEGYPRLFDRTDTNVSLMDGEEVTALVYFGYDTRLFDSPIVEGGVWSADETLC